MGYRAIVHWQVAAAVVVLAIACALALRLAPPLVASRADWLLQYAWAYALPLACAVFAMMFERAGSADAILGYRADAQPRGLRAAILQNTLEQTVLGAVALAAFAGTAPAGLLGLVPVAAGLFLAGRVLFAAGYASSPMRRFFGFALNFYASAALLLAAMWFQVVG